MKESSAYEIVPGDFTLGLLLICDHARNIIPPEYDNLGLSKVELERHIAYDIGAEAITRRLAETLGVPAVLAGFSRLLIDANRGEDDPTLIRQIYDGTVIPGNYPINDKERQNRLKKFHRPYHNAINETIKGFEDAGIVPAIFSVHTMTDMWKDKKRPWQMSVLWDSDPRFAISMLEELRKSGDLCVGENQPYDGALGNDTMFRHCTSKGLPHALIEFRQDLVRKTEDAHKWADLVAPMIKRVNSLNGVHEVRHFDSRTGLQ